MQSKLRFTMQFYHVTDGSIDSIEIKDVGEMSEGEMSCQRNVRVVDEISVDEMYVGQMPVGEMTGWRNVCRRNVCRRNVLIPNVQSSDTLW